MKIEVKTTYYLTEDRKVKYIVLVFEDGLLDCYSISKDREQIIEKSSEVSEILTAIDCLKYAVWYLNSRDYFEPIILETEQSKIIEFTNHKQYEVSEADIVNRKIYGLKKTLEQNTNIKLQYYDSKKDKQLKDFIEEHFPKVKAETTIKDVSSIQINVEDITAKEFFELIENQ